MTDGWYELRAAVNAVAPDLDPPPVHWLESDASESYCGTCILIARGREFELGPLLKRSDWFKRDEWEDAFLEGIGSHMHRCDGHSDTTEQCAICGCTLGYWLTDYGIESEIEHWEEAEMSGDPSEIAYNIDRLFECSDDQKEVVRIIANRFLEKFAVRAILEAQDANT